MLLSKILFVLQEFIYGLSQQQAVVDKLNDKGRDLDRKASLECQTHIDQQIRNMNERWNVVNTQAEDKLKDAEVGLANNF